MAKKQLKIDWKLIRRLALEHGVKLNAYYRWRDRWVVPHKLRLAFILESRGALTNEMFIAMDRKRRRMQAAKAVV